MALFLCLFAAQAAYIVLVPLIVDAANDLHATPAAIAQLRVPTAIAAALAALAGVRLGARIGLRKLLLTSLVLVAAGATASAAAPTLGALAAAQFVVGAGLSLVATTAFAAGAEWSTPATRSHVLAWAQIGPPLAWTIGLPVSGALAAVHWRLALLGVPVASALAAAALVARQPDRGSFAARPSYAAALRDRRVRAWAVAEAVVATGWIGMLGYSGALFAESYGLSASATGLIVGIAAFAYVPGTFVFRGHVDRSASTLLIRLPLTVALALALLGTVRISPAFSAVVFAAAVFAAAGRTFAGNSWALAAAGPRYRLELMGIRTAASHVGALLGAAGGGAALTLGGYDAVGMFFSAVLVAGAGLGLLTRTCADGACARGLPEPVPA